MVVRAEMFGHDPRVACLVVTSTARKGDGERLHRPRRHGRCHGRHQARINASAQQNPQGDIGDQSQPDTVLKKLLELIDQFRLGRCHCHR